jgi:hypothetical protein
MQTPQLLRTLGTFPIYGYSIKSLSNNYFEQIFRTTISNNNFEQIFRTTISNNYFEQFFRTILSKKSIEQLFRTGLSNKYFEPQSQCLLVCLFRQQPIWSEQCFTSSSQARPASLIGFTWRSLLWPLLQILRLEANVNKCFFASYCIRVGRDRH